MRKHVAWLFLIALVMVMATVTAVTPARAHSGLLFAQQQEVEFKLEKLSDSAYALFGRGGNIGFVVTDDGILVVDDQFENIAEGIVEEIRKVSDRPIRFLVNTHYHGDHTGGNPVFGKFAMIVAHDNVRVRMLRQPEFVLREVPGQIAAVNALLAASTGAPESFLEFLGGKKSWLERSLEGARDFDPASKTPPVLTYSDRIQFHLGGETVQVYHFSRGHTDGDSLVYFPQQKVLHMGDLFFNGNYPFIDRAGGGHAGGWVEAIDRILEVVPDDVTIIPGHGPIASRDDLVYHRNYLADLRKEVGAAVRSGKTLQQTIEAIDMKEYDRIEPWFMKLENNIDVVFEEISEGD